MHLGGHADVVTSVENVKQPTRLYTDTATTDGACLPS